VDQAIVDFAQDDLGDWVALLECGHRQHVRHDPPFLERPWVHEAGSRQRWIGRPLNCRLCDQEADGAVHGGPMEGGEPPCLAEDVCPECGAVLDRPGGEGHRLGCSQAAGRVRENYQRND
jgi:hypothetical protein